MDAIAVLREQMGLNRWLLDGTLEGVTTEQLHWQPAGAAHSVASTYAHLVLGEDFVVNSMIQGKAPLAATTWAGKTGVSEPPPQGSEGTADWSQWAKTMRVDLSALRQYAQAVAASTDEYLANLKPEDLERQLDTPLGKMSVNGLFFAAVIGHLPGHTGEIAAVKGLQGLKGYPV
jgi:hypothetical protein